jgi:DNA modification methylase
MTVQILKGDCREVLRTLPDESVHCIVTSPPYFGLRDYGVAGQIGLEATPEAFTAELVRVFAELRRVLRKDGTAWLNLGDSYAANAATATGVKAKDLLGIPWRVAFALQADGWYLRQDIIWSKPNPMPESVRDRCTKAHEYLFLLSRSERYHYDADAIADDATARLQQRLTLPTQDPKAALYGGQNFVDGGISTTRNKRSVWEVTTQPFSEAHFATFPPALIEPCILAGCPSQCCTQCGAPWVRVEIRGESHYAKLGKITGSELGKTDTDPRNQASGGGQTRTASGAVPSLKPAKRQTIGFSPSCTCNVTTTSGMVLDPFGGAGTTGLVADRLGRNAILIELNEAYAEMAERRIRGDAGMFAEVTT